MRIIGINYAQAIVYSIVCLYLLLWLVADLVSSLLVDTDDDGDCWISWPVKRRAKGRGRATIWQRPWRRETIDVEERLVWRESGEGKGEPYKYVCCASYLQFVRIEYSFKRSIVSLLSAGRGKGAGAGRSVLSWHSYLTRRLTASFPHCEATSCNCRKQNTCEPALTLFFVKFFKLKLRQKLTASCSFFLNCSFFVL